MVHVLRRLHDWELNLSYVVLNLCTLTPYWVTLTLTLNSTTGIYHILLGLISMGLLVAQGEPLDAGPPLFPWQWRTVRSRLSSSQLAGKLIVLATAGRDIASTTSNVLYLRYTYQNLCTLMLHGIYKCPLKGSDCWVNYFFYFYFILRIIREKKNSGKSCAWLI